MDVDVEIHGLDAALLPCMTRAFTPRPVAQGGILD
jgi:hypothetical protein